MVAANWFGGMSTIRLRVLLALAVTSVSLAWYLMISGVYRLFLIHSSREVSVDSSQWAAWDFIAAFGLCAISLFVTSWSSGFSDRRARLLFIGSFAISGALFLGYMGAGYLTWLIG